MLHLKVLIKSLLHNKWITFIHAGGLAIAFTFVLLLSFYIKTESSVDKFHEQEKNIYRVLRDPPLRLLSSFRRLCERTCCRNQSIYPYKTAEVSIQFFEIGEKSINSSDNHISLFLDEVECMDKTRL